MHLRVSRGSVTWPNRGGKTPEEVVRRFEGDLHDSGLLALLGGEADGLEPAQGIDRIHGQLLCEYEFPVKNDEKHHNEKRYFRKTRPSI